MPKIRKKTSKRVSTKQRVKVQKKVREHHRKSRRDAKKDPTWRSKKKQDPGIPNSYPYKEQLLNEIEQRRMQAEQQRIAAREESQSQAHAVSQEGEEEEEEEEGTASQAPFDGKGKGPSTQLDAVPRMLDGTLSDFVSNAAPRKALNVAAVVFLLDARDPGSWRVPQVEKAISKARCETVFGISRADLVPREPLAMWLAHLESSTKCKAFPLCSPAPYRNGQKARAGAGIDTLVKHLETAVQKATASIKGEKSAVAVLGVENSGRTLLANILAASLPSATVYDTPSLTIAHPRRANLSSSEADALSKQQEKEEQGEETKEAMAARDEEAAHRVLVRNAGGIFKVREPLPLIEALMRRVSQDSDLMVAFNTPAFVDLNDFLISVARASGRLKKKAVPDTTAAARNILFAWSQGQLGYYSVPPSSKSVALKSAAEQAKKRIESDKTLASVVLTRKDWRQKWAGKELRLKTNEKSMLGDEDTLVAFAKLAEQTDAEESGDISADDDGEDEDEDVNLDDEELDQDEDVDFDEDEEEEEDDEEE